MRGVDPLTHQARRFQSAGIWSLLFVAPTKAGARHAILRVRSKYATKIERWIPAFAGMTVGKNSECPRCGNDGIVC